MTFGAESFQSGSNVIAIIQNFTLVSLTSTTTLYPVRLLFRVAFPSLLTHLTSHYLCNWNVFLVVVSICNLSICRGMRFIILKCY